MHRPLKHFKGDELFERLTAHQPLIERDVLPSPSISAADRIGTEGSVGAAANYRVEVNVCLLHRRNWPPGKRRMRGLCHMEMRAPVCGIIFHYGLFYVPRLLSEERGRRLV